MNNTQRLGEETRKLTNQGTSRHHSDNSVIKTDSNTEKSPKDLIRLAITHTPVKDHKLTPGVEKLTRSNNNNKMVNINNGTF